MTTTLRVRNVRTSKAKCAGLGDLMFSETPEDVAEAKSICEGCPERRKCLNFALDNEISFGVWAGTEFEERTRMCPVCRGPKAPEALGCSQVHTLERLARLVQLEAEGDPNIAVSGRGVVTAPTSPGCLQPRGRSHSSANAYRSGCRCAASREAIYRERSKRGEDIDGGRPRSAPPREPSPELDRLDRFLAFVKVEGDHWWWTGAKNGSAYGNFWDGTKTVRANRYAYQVYVGPLEPHERLRAKGPCVSNCCVNPAHYEKRQPYAYQ